MCAESPDFPAGRGRADKALRAEDWLLPASLRGLRPVLPLLKAGCFWKSQPDPTNSPTVCCSSPCPNRCESRILQRLAQAQTLTGQDRCRPQTTGAAMATPADALSAHFCLARPGYPPPPGHGRFKPPIYVHAGFFSTWSVRPQTYFLLPGKLLSIL